MHVGLFKEVSSSGGHEGPLSAQQGKGNEVLSNEKQVCVFVFEACADFIGLV